MDLLGKKLGQYEILAEIGHGGMATVYRGYQTSLNRSVAVKVLAGELARDAGFRERFAREAHAVAQLAHPNILPVYDFGEDPETGVVYFVTQLVEGGTLAARMSAPLPPNEAARIVAQLARALDYAHACGIVHRDVKPANVLMTRDGHPLLSDFGIAKIVAETKLTQTGTSMGTPEYMSPEQAQGLPVDHRSDIYSLGVMLYALLSATLPFQADTPVALLHQHAYEPPPPLRERAPGVSKSLEKIVMRALAKDPNERFATAGELADALNDEVEGRRSLLGLGRRTPRKVTPVAMPGAPTEIVGPALVAPVAPPRPVTRLGRPTTQQKVGRAAKGFGRWLLRIVLSALAILLVVAMAVLVGAAFVLGAMAEQAIASQRWAFETLGPGYEERVACADIQKSVEQALRPYLLDALTDVLASCRPPDTVEVSGKFRGEPVSLGVRVTSLRGVPAVQLERLNNAPFFIIGGILSDGINRGLSKAWANAPVRLKTFAVSPAAIELVYEANPNAPAQPAPSPTSQVSAFIQVSNTTTRTATVELNGPVSKSLVVAPKESLPLSIPPGKYFYTVTVANLGVTTGDITWGPGEHPWVIR